MTVLTSQAMRESLSRIRLIAKRQGEYQWHPIFIFSRSSSTSTGLKILREWSIHVGNDPVMAAKTLADEGKGGSGAFGYFESTKDVSSLCKVSHIFKVSKGLKVRQNQTICSHMYDRPTF
jgi:hypothetical protein